MSPSFFIGSSGSLLPMGIAILLWKPRRTNGSIQILRKKETPILVRNVLKDENWTLSVKFIRDLPIDKRFRVD